MYYIIIILPRLPMVRINNGHDMVTTIGFDKTATRIHRNHSCARANILFPFRANRRICLVVRRRVFCLFGSFFINDVSLFCPRTRAYVREATCKGHVDTRYVPAENCPKLLLRRIRVFIFSIIRPQKKLRKRSSMARN